MNLFKIYLLKSARTRKSCSQISRSKVYSDPGEKFSLYYFQINKYVLTIGGIWYVGIIILNWLQCTTVLLCILLIYQKNP